MSAPSPVRSSIWYGPSQIEELFRLTVSDLHIVFVIDAIEAMPDGSGYLLRSHDRSGPLPEITARDTGDRLADKDALARDICKLAAIVRVREELCKTFPKCRFLPPEALHGTAYVGIITSSRAWIGKGRDFLQAYQDIERLTDSGV